MTIKTRSMTWVKKHCTYQDGWREDGTGSYTFEDHRGNLYTPNMSRLVCGKSFTVRAVRNGFVCVEETAFSIPIWLLIKKSQEAISRDPNIS